MLSELKQWKSQKPLGNIVVPVTYDILLGNYAGSIEYLK